MSFLLLNQREKMELKPENERKIKNGCYSECIAKGCKNRPNGMGLCWDHQKESNKEEIE